MALCIYNPVRHTRSVLEQGSDVRLRTCTVYIYQRLYALLWTALSYISMIKSPILKAADLGICNDSRNICG